MLALLACSATIQAQTDKKPQRTFAIWGHLRDSFTKAIIKEAKITLMDADSTVIDTMTSKYFIARGNNSDDAWYRFERPAKPGKFIIKASHPDYEDCYVDLNIPFVARNRFFDAKWHYMKRKLKSDTDYELSLDSVVVKATRVKMVFRGDTIVYDASAFKLPDGSMLDALIRQLPGAELDDNGVITIQGRKVDYLMLNGKDFFKGDNKVMLDNLPYYAVQDVKVYDRTTDKSRFMGRDVEQKEYVMDVNLKKQYNHGYMANIGLGGATGNHYLARIFANSFTDTSRLSVYAGANNINAGGNPDSQGNWNSSSTTEGTLAYRTAGLGYRTDSKNNWAENNLNIQTNWNDRNNLIGSDSERFFSSGKAYTFGDNRKDKRDRNITLSNHYKKKLPVWLESKTNIEIADGRTKNLTRSAALDSKQESYTDASAALDSVFSNTISSALSHSLVNTTHSMSLATSKQTSLSQELNYNTKLPWGDNIEFEADGYYSKQSQEQNLDYRLRYLQTNVNDFRNVYTDGETEWAKLHGRIEYYLNFLNSWTCRFYSLYEHETNRSPYLYYRLDQLSGWLEQNHDFGYLPSADSLQLAMSAGDSHHMKTIRGNWNSGFNIYLQKETDSTYLWLRFHLPVMRIYDRTSYQKASVDTVASRTKWVMNGNINFQYRWNQKRNQIRANLWHNTIQPNMSSFVVFSNTNPLATTLAATSIKNSEKWLGNVAFGHSAKSGKISYYIHAEYGHINNPIVTGNYYNPANGSYSYRDTNAKSADSFSSFGNINGQLGKWTYYVGMRGEIGKSQTLELDANLNGTKIIDTKQYYMSPSSSLAYQQGTFRAKFATYMRFANNKFGDASRSDYSTYFHNIEFYLQYTIPVVKLQLVSSLTYQYNDCSLPNVRAIQNWLWHTNLQRSFLKGDKLTVMLAATDILKNVSNHSYSADANSFSHDTTERIGRMLMLSLQYKLFKQNGTKNNK